MQKVGIVGISGYSGGELLRLLLNHPEIRITYVSANNTTGSIDQIWPNLKGRTKLYCAKFDPVKAAGACDVIFLAVPHTVAHQIAPGLIKHKKRVIDLSADYRLKDYKLYKKWYKTTHADKRNLAKAVYGLPELYRQDIKTAALVANPGCYPTAAILALAPLVMSRSKEIQSITIDAKSGTSGAGKKAAIPLSFSEANENIKAYRILCHQHTPEINAYLSALAKAPIETAFVPHLIPMTRGILETVYVRLKSTLDIKKLQDLYKKFYKKEPFVRVLNPGQQPEVKNVNYTNYCDIGLTINAEHRLVVVTAAIDNLIKGAAGQAVQNMNIMCGFPEDMAL